MARITEGGKGTAEGLTGGTEIVPVMPAKLVGEFTERKTLLLLNAFSSWCVPSSGSTPKSTRR